MTRLMDYLLEPQTAVVFDIDGVLAIYEFGELSHSACPDEDWEDYVRTHDPYASSRPVPQIQRFIADKGADHVWACSQASDFETLGKRAFVTRCYELDPSHVVTVTQKAEKVEFLRRLARELGIPERRVAIVEDTVKTLDLVDQETGCVTVHVSSFFDYGI
ncbi:hypothetical protein [Olsenella sp. Marseille-P4559]|uniref:hypothetical protein n=1 Tax=Olsenella sp. Marseille-P4559 TaxID=2364795 RepID=UPI00102F7713|nr:hypothetical protein [Olsenella sp. Marseille-P4559]